MKKLALHILSVLMFCNITLAENHILKLNCDDFATTGIIFTLDLKKSESTHGQNGEVKMPFFIGDEYFYFAPKGDLRITGRWRHGRIKINRYSGIGITEVYLLNSQQNKAFDNRNSELFEKSFFEGKTEIADLVFNHYKALDLFKPKESSKFKCEKIEEKIF